MKCIALDDEPLALRLVKNYAERTGMLEMTGDFTDAIKAKEFIEQNPVDLVLIDIQMPDISGLQFIHSLEKKADGYFHYSFH